MCSHEPARRGQYLNKSPRQLRQPDATHYLVKPIGEQLVIDIVVEKPQCDEPLNNARQGGRVRAIHVADRSSDALRVDDAERRVVSVDSARIFLDEHRVEQQLD
jgi:hypothetical protein